MRSAERCTMVRSARYPAVDHRTDAHLGVSEAVARGRADRLGVPYALALTPSGTLLCPAAACGPHRRRDLSLRRSRALANGGDTHGARHRGGTRGPTGMFAGTFG